MPSAPEFDIDPNTRNNGIIGVLNGTGIDITKSTLFTILLKLMVPLMALMHTGNLATIQNVIGHYGTINKARKY
jgi:cytochrome c peroxidase